MSNKENMSRSENWIAETLGMADRIQRMEPDENLMSRLKNIPQQASALYDTVPKKVMWGVAASLALLLFLNIFSYRNYSDKTQTNTIETTDSYFSYLKQL